MNAFDCDLLVVGLGPVGDVLAALARLHGLTVIAIDREPDQHHLPRAAVFDDEVMRIFQMTGVADRLLPFCRVPDNYQFLSAQREVLLNFPITAAGSLGWAKTYAMHQPAIERVLRQRLVEVGVQTRLGVTFEGLTQDEQAVLITVRDRSGLDAIRARYVVGCDGASSSVREASGITLIDYGFDERWLVLDTIIDGSDPLPLVAQQICDPDRPVTHFGMSGNRYRWEFMLKPEETPERILSDDVIRSLLAPWKCVDRLEIERKAVYHFHALIAQQWQRGRVLLAGDAAHQMPPFAGQGMCSGIRDAANLVWKLAAVIRGAPEKLLDSYEAERSPHVRTIIETSIAMGKIVCMIDRDAAAARDREMLARRVAGEQQVSLEYPPLHGGLLRDDPASGTLLPQPLAAERLDTLLGCNAALIGRDLPTCDTPGLVMLDLDEPSLASFAPALDIWLETLGTSAALARPDRHIFGTGDPVSLLSDWSRTVDAGEWIGA